MTQRWLSSLQGQIPDIDLRDVKTTLENPKVCRQFAAEFSDSSYRTMLGSAQDDQAIGDYVAKHGGNRFSYQERERLMSIIQDLHKKKEYKQETLHLAGNLADRYLSQLLENYPQSSVPNIYALGATALLMAAKLEQPISPSFNRMIALLPAVEQKRITKKQLIDLEEKILCALEFSLHSAGPIAFLERYQRIFDIDRESEEHDFKQVGYTAR